MSRPELDGQVFGQVDDGGFGGGVGERGVGAEGSDSDAGDGGGYDHARRVLQRGAGFEEGFEFLDGVEDALDVQVHDFGEGGVGVGFESLAPGGAGVGEEDVDVWGCFGDFGGEAADFADFGQVSGDGDCGCVGAFGFQGVEGLDGFFACGGFARGDIYFAAAGLEEAGAGG